MDEIVVAQDPGAAVKTDSWLNFQRLSGKNAWEDGVSEGGGWIQV